ncbi:GAF domain-containing protein [Oculatella sp. LEGE 06141]|uniref:methyl-accepting chemotaxis protein n=1 Tax=Oculatella sp. LEGE 06141 TaxID=1828648 RepID=UPI001880DB4E|nr:GAF domain-containing protein [Oculatella sp. LEGE 06141]MBE9180922.1 GAF domain-containing protein [Oculatella sp. LEGE 06141]
MTQPSPQKQTGQRLNQSSNQQQRSRQGNAGRVDAARRQEPALSSGQRSKGLQAKVTLWAIAVSVLPVLAIGGATYYLGSQAVARQTEAREQGELLSWVDAEQTFQRQLALVLLGTGATAALSGAIAAILAKRAVRPVIETAATSTTLVNRLRRDRNDLPSPAVGRDEMTMLESNINFIKDQLPEMLWKQEAKTERSRVFLTITRHIREARTESDVFKVAVEAVRNVLRVDRVAVFRFDQNWNGTCVEESVASGLPKMLWTPTADTWFEKNAIQHYQNGRVQAVDSIYQSDLDDATIGSLETFAVKAFLTAPILKDDELVGLLVGHQCTEARVWDASEIDLFTQLAIQMGYALDYANLLEQVDTRADQAQLCITITRQIRESLNEEDVLKTTVEEIRKVLTADRVVVYSFDPDWYGTVIAESVVPGFPKALRAKIKDPCFAEGFVAQYQAGRVQATNNIYEAGLTPCYLKQLEPFSVKANLVAPILNNEKLFGLLIAHQCSGPREWQKPEIDLFSQLALQVGFALDHARLLQRIDAEGSLTQMLADITRRIRASLNEEDVLKTTVEEIRKALSADRVVVYSFDPDWYGTVIAESVVIGFPKALRAKIKDPCFAEGYVSQYQAGRVQATKNIYEAGLTPCYLKQLEPFAVKANLVAPILKDEKLFGLLIAHQCSGPRDWQKSEIDLFSQLALQLGFALDHARLLAQFEQMSHTAEDASYEDRQQRQVLQQQVTESLHSSQAIVQRLAKSASQQMEVVTAIHTRMQALVDTAQGISASAQRAVQQDQRLDQTMQVGQDLINRLLEGTTVVRETVDTATQKFKQLEQPSQKLSQVVASMSKMASQTKLQAMNAALKSASSGATALDFATMAEKVLSLSQQLDADISSIRLLVAELQGGMNEAIANMETGAERAFAETELSDELHQSLSQMTDINTELIELIEEVARASATQVDISTAANRAVLQVANLASQTSDQTASVAQSFARLAEFTQD